MNEIPFIWNLDKCSLVYEDSNLLFIYLLILHSVDHQGLNPTQI